jgi:hypothetical protein
VSPSCHSTIIFAKCVLCVGCKQSNVKGPTRTLIRAGLSMYLISSRLWRDRLARCHQQAPSICTGSHGVVAGAQRSESSRSNYISHGLPCLDRVGEQRTPNGSISSPIAYSLTYESRKTRTMLSWWLVARDDRFAMQSCALHLTHTLLSLSLQVLTQKRRGCEAALAA